MPILSQQPGAAIIAAQQKQYENQTKSQIQDTIRQPSVNDPDVIIVKTSSYSNGKNWKYTIVTPTRTYTGTIDAEFASRRYGYKTASEWATAEAKKIEGPGFSIFVNDELKQTSSRTLQEAEAFVIGVAQKKAQEVVEKAAWEKYQQEGLRAFKEGVAFGDIRGSSEAIKQLKTEGYNVSPFAEKLSQLSPESAKGLRRMLQSGTTVFASKETLSEGTSLITKGGFGETSKNLPDSFSGVLRIKQQEQPFITPQSIKDLSLGTGLLNIPKKENIQHDKNIFNLKSFDFTEKALGYTQKYRQFIDELYPGEKIGYQITKGVLKAPVGLAELGISVVPVTEFTIKHPSKFPEAIGYGFPIFASGLKTSITTKPVETITEMLASGKIAGKIPVSLPLKNIGKFLASEEASFFPGQRLAIRPVLEKPLIKEIDLRAEVVKIDMKKRIMDDSYYPESGSEFFDYEAARTSDTFIETLQKPKPIIVQKSSISSQKPVPRTATSTPLVFVYVLIECE